MNKKRLLTVSLALGVAFLMVSIPYTQNADAIIGVVAAFVVGAAVGYEIYNHFLSHSANSNNIIYSPSSNEMINRISSYMDKKDAEYNSLQTHINNMLELYNETNLYYQRIAEKEVLNYVDRDNWTDDIVKNVTDDFDNFTLSIYYNIVNEYANFLSDLDFEIDGIRAMSGINIKIYCSNAGGYDWSFVPYEISMKIGSAGNYVQLGQIYVSNFSILNSTYTSVSDLLSASFEIGFWGSAGVGDVSKGAITSTNYVFVGLNDVYISDGSHKSPSYSIEFQITNSTNVIKRYPIVSDASHQVGSSPPNKWAITVGNLKTLYTNIRDNIVNSAYTYWNYIRSLGYHNLTEIPDAYIPVYPDAMLDDLYNLANVSDYNTSYALYNAMMRQLMDNLNNELQNNGTTPINWTNMDIANFTGIKFIVSLSHADANSGNTGTIFVNHLCYLIPYADVTLQNNTIYAIWILGNGII